MTALISKLRGLIFKISFLLWTAIMALYSLPLMLVMQNPRDRLIPISRRWAHGVDWLLCRIVGVDVEIQGHEHLPAGGAYMLACKHQSQWDTSVVLRLFDNPAVILKQELLRIPVYGRFAHMLGMIAVDRDGGARALKAMLRAAAEAARQGRVLVIFPQGTRTRPGEAAPYQPGVAAIYRETGVPVVPATVNSGFVWPKHGWPRLVGHRPRPKIVLRFLPAIAPGLKRDAFMAELEQRIEGGTAQLEAETRRHLGL
ncbi:lysophospholipid acyltransferase family protein [Ferrovibrio sp.]|uniref:lysophospholipid acyltransferase family protein n=1 Tax=Ferrovibrio sp. TaxID=1917215 RepID=UPI0035AE0073